MLKRYVQDKGNNKAGVHPLLVLPASGVQCPFAYRRHQSCMFRIPDKLGCGKHSLFWVMPSHQYFNSRNAAALQVELRLIMQAELSFVQCTLQFLFQLLRLFNRGAHLVPIELEVVSAAAFCLVQRQVGHLDQLLGIFGVIGK